MELLALTLQEADTENPSIFNRIFGVEEELQKASLDVIVKRGVITGAVFAGTDDSFFFKCPKLLSEA